MSTSKRTLSGISSKLICLILLSLMLLPLMAESALQGLVILSSDWGYEEKQLKLKVQGSLLLLKLLKIKIIMPYFLKSAKLVRVCILIPNPVWSTLFDEEDPGFDPLEIALDLTHDAGLQFYAKFDVLKGYSKVNKPESTDHVFSMHPEWFLKGQ